MGQKKKNKKPIKRLSKRMIIILTTVLTLGSVTAFAAYVDVNQQATRDNAQRIAMFEHPGLTWKKWTGDDQESKEAAKKLSSIASSDYKKSTAGKQDQILSKAHSGVTQSQGEKIDDNTAKRMASYQKKHPNATESEMKKKESTYTREEATKTLGSSKGSSYANKVSAANESLASGDDGSGEATGLWGKIGKAMLHIFWSSAIGQWLTDNTIGATVFNYQGSGDISDKEVIKDLQKKAEKDPMQLMYPGTDASGYSGKMSDMLTKFRGAFYGAAMMILVISVIFSGIKLGWGQAVNSFQSRVQWYHNMVDIVLATVGVILVPVIYKMVLSVNGAILLGFENMMASIPTSNSDGSLLSTALHLGMTSDAIKLISSGSFIGDNFSGIIFNIIYLITMIGLAIYVKYYYFVRMIAFTILASMGGIFIAFWPYQWGKSRTIAWFKDLLGTVFIQSIHAFTLAFMAMLMQINTEAFNSIKEANSSPTANFLTEFFSGNFASATAEGMKLQVAHWETMVIGFIILILFQPVSRSLAELFGISTNMLENIHKSTSRTLMMAGGIAAGAAVGAGVLGANVAAGGLAKAVGSAAKTGVGKKLAKSKLGQLNSVKKFGNKLMDKKGRHKAEAEAVGIIGSRLGQLSGMAVGAGADSMTAMLAGSVAGGKVGLRAARLASQGASAAHRKLTEMALDRADPLKSQRENLSAAGVASKNAINDSIKQRVDVNPGEIIPDASSEHNGNAIREKAAANVEALEKVGVKDGKPTDKMMQGYKQQQAKKLTEGTFMSNRAVQNSADEQAAAFKGSAAEAWKAEHPFEEWKDGDGANVFAKNTLDKWKKNGGTQGSWEDVAEQYGANELAKATADGNKLPEGITAEQFKEQAINKWKAENPYNKWNEDQGNKVYDKAKKDWQDGSVSENEQQALWHNQADAVGDKAMTSFKQAAQISADQAGAATKDAFVPFNASDIKTKEQLQSAVASDWKQAHPMDSWLSKNEGKTAADWASAASDYGKSFVDNNDYTDYVERSFANTDGRILAHTDQSQNKEFMNSVINSDTFNRRFKENLAGALADNEIDPAVADTLVQNYHDGDVTSGITGESIIQTIGDGKDATKVVNADLLSRLNAQQAYTVGNTYDLSGDAQQFNREALDMLYSGQAVENIPDIHELQQGYSQAMRQTAKEYANNVNPRGAIADATVQGSQKYDLFGSALRVARPSIGSMGYGGSGYPGSAAEQISDNPFSVSTDSLSLNEARDMVPKQTNDRGETSTVPGALRMVVENTNSYLEVQDRDGYYHTLGKLGAGDGNLSASDQVYQNMEFTPSGDIVPMIDRKTHSATGPYRVVNGEYVPAALPAGLPNVDSFFGGTRSRNISNSLGYQNLPKSDSLMSALDNNTAQPTLDLYQGFTGFDLRGDSNGMVLTGVNPANGKREVLTNSYQYDRIPLNEGVEFVQPLRVSNGELRFGKQPPKFSFNPFSYGENEKATMSQGLTNKINQNSSDLISFANDTMIKPTKPVMSNFIANNSPHHNLSAIDLYSKLPKGDD